MGSGQKRREVRFAHGPAAAAVGGDRWVAADLDLRERVSG
jgi:hypothetical protein